MISATVPSPSSATRPLASAAVLSEAATASFDPTPSATNWPILYAASSRFLSATDGIFGPVFYRFYRRILKFSLRYRFLVLAITGGIFAAALYAGTYIPQSFFPSGDRNQYLIYLDLPAGTRIEETDRTVRKLSTWLQDKEQNPEVTGTIAYVGNGGPRFFLSLAPVDPDNI